VVLRKVGGSIMLALPPALLDMVELAAGQQVDVSVEEGRILVEPRRRPRYTLAELLSRCDPAAPRPDEERDWLQAPPAGAELL
jgi:antitoxin ChpS